MNINKANIMKSILPLLVLVPLGLASCGYEQVEEGFRGIKTTWGKMVGDPLPPDIYFYNPISSDIFEMDVREQKLEGGTDCFTKDTQLVRVNFAVTYYPQQDKIGQLYSQFGREWGEKIIMPAVLGSVKDAIGQYIADDLVATREKVKMAAEGEIRTALKERDVIVTRLDLTNLDFDDQYERAVEDKVVAIQRAQEAKNKSVTIEEEARQSVMKAKAEAESMRIRSEALSQNKGLVEYEKVQKWDGKLPQIMLGTGSMPIINANDFLK